MTPDVSVLLVNWNTRELTQRCLDSLPRSIDDELTYEVVVVDNGSRDGSVDMLSDRSDVQLIANSENRGYAVAVNQAYERATGPLILLLNSDVDFKDGALSILARFLEENPHVAGVGPLYLNPDGSPQAHHYRLPSFTMQLANASALLRNIPPFSWRVREYRMLDDDFSHPRQVPQPSASCLLLRRACLPEDHLMDERYPIYFNDVALARSLALGGHGLWMTPNAVVVHEHGASTRMLGGAHKRQHIGALVRYLAVSEPSYRLLLFRAVVLTQGLGAAVLRRPDSLPPGELWKAVKGDPGPLPHGPTDG